MRSVVPTSYQVLGTQQYDICYLSPTLEFLLRYLTI